MASQIVITMDDLESAVRLNAALEAAQFNTTMFSHWMTREAPCAGRIPDASAR
jgi:hypothetical protein